MLGQGAPEETMLVYHCAGNGNGQPRCPVWANATEGDKECYPYGNPHNSTRILLEDFVQTLYVATDDFIMMNMTVHAQCQCVPPPTTPFACLAGAQTMHSSIGSARCRSPRQILMLMSTRAIH